MRCQKALLERELFGCVRDSSGDHARDVGGLEAAEGGTAFIADVCEIPVALQLKLKRVVERRELVRVGASSAVPVDVRVIAATSAADLRVAIHHNILREDLYYALNGTSLNVPALRDPPLARKRPTRSSPRSTSLPLTSMR